MGVRSVTFIIFDLDGTLVDSAGDLQSVANAMLSEHGLSPYTLDEMTGFIGHGIKNLVNQCLLGRKSEGPVPDIEAAYARVLELYHEAPCAHSSLYPGVEDLLPSLKARGVKMAVCTNKAEDLALKLLEGLGVAAHFDVVVGSMEGRARKPDPEPVRLCLDALGAKIGETLYIGDSETDEATAHGAGLPFVFHTNGYRHKMIEEFSFAFMIDDFTQFEEKLDAWAAGS